MIHSISKAIAWITLLIMSLVYAQFTSVNLL